VFRLELSATTIQTLSSSWHFFDTCYIIVWDFEIISSLYKNEVYNRTRDRQFIYWQLCSLYCQQNTIFWRLEAIKAKVKVANPIIFFVNHQYDISIDYIVNWQLYFSCQFLKNHHFKNHVFTCIGQSYFAPPPLCSKLLRCTIMCVINYHNIIFPQKWDISVMDNRY
jgi:hypothetical protein